MKAEEVKAIRDALGDTKALAERLEITERAARYLVANGAKRRSTISRLKALAKRRGRGGGSR